MPYPGYQLARAHKVVRAVGGDMTLNSTGWANIGAATGGPGAAGFDITLLAEVGDVIAYSPNFLLSNAAVDYVFDVVTIVSAAAVNSLANAGAVTANSPGTSGSQGVAGWYTQGGRLAGLGPTAWYTVVAGDLVSGYVTLRPRYAGISATNRTLYCSATNPVQFMAQNIGPVDPH